MKSKYYIGILFLLTILASCSTYHPENIYNYYNGSSFYNDSLSISVNFFGDTKISNPKIEDKKFIKSSIKGLKDIKLRNLIVFGTCYDPDYNVFLFYKKLLLSDKKQN
ncbi:hypothetical protein [Pseudotamlana carrageenivorans]|uniref:DUF4136 domain-containing protein n=1 Tax=Pseudotamlana carrageenivorans TaxID=2069432 RepID=A0A2I7SM86_9FLAO|nr:hypothetical protein [Tamlana carrageenivorans]AUS07011.1 hypothetical protein C1A40_16855 [Tamlana carrageenivorans]